MVPRLSRSRRTAPPEAGLLKVLPWVLGHRRAAVPPERWEGQGHLPKKFREKRERTEGREEERASPHKPLGAFQMSQGAQGHRAPGSQGSGLGGPYRVVGWLRAARCLRFKSGAPAPAWRLLGEWRVSGGNGVDRGGRELVRWPLSAARSASPRVPSGASDDGAERAVRPPGPGAHRGLCGGGSAAGTWQTLPASTGPRAPLRDPKP